MKRIGLFVVAGIWAAASVGGQTAVKTVGSVETEGQLVSTIGAGKAPLVVSSLNRVQNLNADTVDGFDGVDLDDRLTVTEMSLIDLLGQGGASVPARVARTGQTSCYDAAGALSACGLSGQDGEHQIGVAWPNPRLRDNGDGTVTDTLTGLVWLADANCLGLTDWTSALALPLGLFDGSTNDPGGSDCGLSDGSMAGDWRLPNVNELASLVHRGFWLPTVTDTAGTSNCSGGTPCAFSGVLSVFYWSSTTLESSPSLALIVSMTGGQIDLNTKASAGANVWPVRDELPPPAPSRPD